MEEIKYLRKMSIFTDATRLKIIYILSYNNYCSIHLEKFLGVSQPNVSRHIDKMIGAEVVSVKKQGRRNIYSLCPDFVENNSEIIKQVQELYSGLITDEAFNEYKIECENM